MNNNPKRNSEGYYDPTAYEGTKNIIREEREVEQLNHRVIQSFRLLTECAGFEIVGRIVLKHKETGRIFR